jgi:hypothetical protein
VNRLLRYLNERGVVPDPWRGPCFSLLVWRPWTAIGVGVGILLALAFGGGGTQAIAASAELYGVFALVVALVGGSVGRARASTRHFVVFQNAGSEVGHFLRLWLLSYCMLTVLVLGVASAFAAQPGSEVHSLAFVVGAVIFATMVFAAAVLATTLVKAGDSALVLLWTLAPIMLTVIAQRNGLGPSLASMLEAPFVPFNAVFSLQGALGTGDWSAWRDAWTIQLIAFPVASIGLAILRLRALERRGSA